MLECLSVSIEAGNILITDSQQFLSTIGQQDTSLLIKLTNCGSSCTSAKCSTSFRVRCRGYYRFADTLHEFGGTITFRDGSSRKYVNIAHKITLAATAQHKHFYYPTRSGGPE